MAQIELCGMKFRAFHGCLPEERRNGNDFSVDFRCEYDTSRAELSDSLEDTLDYGVVYGIVSREMARPSNLLEHVAARIADAVRAAFPGAGRISVTVTKMNPPVAGEAVCSKVTVSR